MIAIIIRVSKQHLDTNVASVGNLAHKVKIVLYGTNIPYTYNIINESQHPLNVDQLGAEALR
jgi:hypothetical protein